MRWPHNYYIVTNPPSPNIILFSLFITPCTVFNILKLTNFLAQEQNKKKFIFQGTMIGPNFMDEIDCGSFFDQIDDLLDFPADDVEAGQANEDCNSLIPNLWQTQPESLPGSDSVFSTNNSASDLSAELSVPVSYNYN